MKRIYLIVAFLILTAFSTSYLSEKESLEIKVKSESEVSISGTSNINSFNCFYNVANLEDPISVSFESRDKKMFFQSTVLELESDCFDCGHKAINKDFKKLLKTELYPKIKLKLIAIEKASKLSNTYNARVKIYIANCSSTYAFPVQVTKDKDIQIKGNLFLDLRDYDLEPPKKMMGLIVVNHDIEVNLNLHLNQL